MQSSTVAARLLKVCRVALLLICVSAAIGVLAASAPSSQPVDAIASIESGRLPAGYRDWRLVSVAREEGNIDDIRAILGNDPAIAAYRAGSPTFPDGTILARLAWSYDVSDENNKAFGMNQSHVAGHPKNGVQFMIKDAKKYAATGGWKYVQFDDGKPLTDAVKLQGCFTCHQGIAERDYVFTRWAK